MPSSGDQLEAAVALLYAEFGATVQRNKSISGLQTDIYVLQQTPDGAHVRSAIECKDYSGALPLSEVTSACQRLSNLRAGNLIDKAILVTRNGITKDGLTHCEAMNVEPLTFADLQRRRRYNFEAYLQSLIQGDGFPDSYNETIAKNAFLPLAASGEDSEIESVVDFVDEWKDGDGQLLTILGEYGSGKTTTCYHLAQRYAREHLSSPEHSRIPILIELKQFAGHGSFRSFLGDFFFHQKGVVIDSYSSFESMNRDGRFIVILDGFDEMTTNIEPLVVFRYFDEILKLQQGNAKVLLTCRSSFFKDRADLDTLGQSSDLESLIHRHRGFKVIKLRELSTEQIQTYLSCFYDSTWIRFYDALDRTPGLRSLAERPILLKMIVSTIHNPSSLTSLSITELYRKYTDIWLTRDNWRCHLTPNQRNGISDVLAWALLRKAQPLMHYTELLAEVRDFFDRDIDPQLLEQYAHEVRTCSFLRSDFRGNLTFAHRSFAEFFVARFMLQKIGSGDYASIDRPIALETMQFVADMVSEQGDYFLPRIWSLLRPETNEAGEPRSRNLRALAFLVLFKSGADLNGQDLSDISIPKGADFSRAHFNATHFENLKASETLWKNAQLSGSNFTGAELSESHFEKADLQRATLNGAILEDCLLASAELNDADFRGSHLKGAIITPRDVLDLVKKEKRKECQKCERVAAAADEFCRSIAKQLEVTYKELFKIRSQDVKRAVESGEENEVISVLSSLISEIEAKVGYLQKIRQSELEALDGNIGNLNRLPAVIADLLELETGERQLRTKSPGIVAQLFAYHLANSGEFMNRVNRARRKLQFEIRRSQLKLAYLSRQIQAAIERIKAAGPVEILSFMDRPKKFAAGAHFEDAVGLTKEQSEWLKRNGAHLKSVNE